MRGPTLEQMMDTLKGLAEVEEIDPDSPLPELEDVDSLDLMELVYSIQEQYEIAVDESVFDEFDETATLRRLYERVMATASVATAQA